jgi:hypothetical protein
MSYLTSTFLLIVTVATIIVMGDASASDMQKPLQLIASTPKRELKNPFAYSRGAQKRITRSIWPSTAAAMEEGHGCAYHQSDLDLWQ